MHWWLDCFNESSCRCRLLQGERASSSLLNRSFVRSFTGSFIAYAPAAAVLFYINSEEKRTMSNRRAASWEGCRTERDNMNKTSNRQFSITYNPNWRDLKTTQPHQQNDSIRFLNVHWTLLLSNEIARQVHNIFQMTTSSRRVFFHLQFAVLLPLQVCVGRIKLLLITLVSMQLCAQDKITRNVSNHKLMQSGGHTTQHTIKDSSLQTDIQTSKVIIIRIFILPL